MAGRRWQKISLCAAILLVLALLVAVMPACAPKPAPPPPAPSPAPAPAPAPPPAPPAKPTELTLASWTGPKEPHNPAMEAFAKELEERSGGRYKVNISYGSVMAKPPEHFDLALTGVAEMAFVGLPWNPGRFRMSELFGLPIRNASAEQASKALWEMYKRGYMDKEFADVKVVFLLTTPAYEYLWAKEPVTSLADFKGKKIRCPGGPWTQVAEALGGVPVSAPVGEIYGMMEKGIVDGANFPWSGIRSYKLAEVTKYATKVSMLYFAFGVIMNKDVWEGLPKDVQAIIDEVGAKYSAMGGRGHDEWNKYGLEDLAKVGVVPTPLPPAEMAKVEKLLAPLWDKWIADNEAKGLPAKKAVDDLYSILTGLGVEDPFIR